MRRLHATVAIVALLTVVASTAHAQQGVPEANNGPATGFTFQTRIAQTTIMSIVGASPGLVLGYRAGPLTIGVGLGLTLGQASTGGDSVDVTLLYAMPMLQYDVWRSADGRARFNLTGAVGIGRASATDKSQVTNFDPTTGAPTGTTTDTSTTTATLIPVRLGIGGDYWLHPSFALGAEAGVDLLFVTGVSTSGGSSDTSFGAQGMYGGLRATMVLGN